MKAPVETLREPTPTALRAADKYTVITFAPVQGFIQNSRKLRDLYGSSFILSYLAKSICDSVCDVCPPEALISPATINLTQGTPNAILIAADFSDEAARLAFDRAWENLLYTCQTWLEKQLPKTYSFSWERNWGLWRSCAWEFFWAQGDTLEQAYQALGRQKSCRDWSAINWRGEGSTLSGADAIAWPEMDLHTDRTKARSAQQLDAQIKTFYQNLAPSLGNIIDPTEQLSIPELVKRLITLEAIATQLNLSPEQLPTVEIPQTFRDLNRFEGNCWTGWFKGDGDGMGLYLRKLSLDDRRQFSQNILKWGATLRDHLPDTAVDTGYSFINNQKQLQHKAGRIIFAGGDDFLGVLYRLPPEPSAEPNPSQNLSDKPAETPVLQPRECLDWLQTFPTIWQGHGYPITVSVGFVWAAPGVPQRDVLQHCDLAEQAAKQAGKDRVALRILFNGGNHLQWICPWRLLPVLDRYRDRDHQTGPAANWTHLYTDIATLEARHAFGDDLSVIQSLLAIYFPDSEDSTLLDPSNWWNKIVPENNPGQAGILGDRYHYPSDSFGSLRSNRHVQRALQHWALNLAKVGFHLHAAHHSQSLRSLAEV